MENFEIDNEKTEKFNRYEKIFFRLELVVISLGVSLLLLFRAFVELIGNMADFFMSVFLLGWIFIILNFFISIIRVLKYLLVMRKVEGDKTIWRSVLTIIISPLAFILYYILIFVIVLASCSV